MLVHTLLLLSTLWASTAVYALKAGDYFDQPLTFDTAIRPQVAPTNEEDGINTMINKRVIDDDTSTKNDNMLKIAADTVTLPAYTQFARDLLPSTTSILQPSSHATTFTTTQTENSIPHTIQIIASEVTDAAGSIYTQFVTSLLPAATSVVGNVVNATDHDVNDTKKWLDGETNGLSNKVLLAIVVAVPVAVVLLVVWIVL
ncbi:hypothetical protein QBC43DRAFT_292036 [Cladorrhinum sp. PSN259]|nr:hypothetical protein QBC43DRAFT_292036 [Cladorrhinum sp. PSN259]